MTTALTVLVVVVVGHRYRPRLDRRLAAAHTIGSGRDDVSGAAGVPTARLVTRMGHLAGAPRRRRSRRRPPPAAVADWCSDIARLVRAGETLRRALLAAEPADPRVRAATDPLRNGLERGRSVAEAATPSRSEPSPRRRPMSARSDVLDPADLALAVVASCGRVGGSPAEPLDRVAAALRQRAADDQERAAQSAQARLSAHVLTVVPLGVLATLVAADPTVRSVLATPAGATCVAVGLTLNGSGWWWMRRIVGAVR